MGAMKALAECWGDLLFYFYVNSTMKYTVNSIPGHEKNEGERIFPGLLNTIM